MSKARLIVLLFVAVAASGSSAWAIGGSGGGGGWSLGAGIGIVNAGQDDMDDVIKAGGSGAGNIGNGMEVVGSLAYDFGDIAMIFRPGYYWVSQDGAGNEYNLSAISFFPTLRFKLLSNQTITFYTQLALGVVMMKGEVKEASYDVEFSGTQLGYSAGLGSEFCFWPDHCFFLEANLRVAGVDRMKVDSTSGTKTNSAITQDTKGMEFELNDRDFSASLSGIQGIVGYNLHF